MVNSLKKNWMDMGFCLILAFLAYILGKQLPIIGGPVFGILISMVVTLFLKDKNVLAALIFPHFGSLIGFSTTSGEAFGIFAGTAVNDTSSVTACAATWDNMWNLGSATLDKAVTVKLTRTLAIIPITLVLSLVQARKAKQGNEAGSTFSFAKVFPFFILFFLGASVITTAATSFGVPSSFFSPIKELSKFFIIWAMAAIGLNTNIINLVKTGGKPLLLGFICWCGITAVSLGMQHVLGIW